MEEAAKAKEAEKSEDGDPVNTGGDHRSYRCAELR